MKVFETLAKRAELLVGRPTVPVTGDQTFGKGSTKKETVTLLVAGSVSIFWKGFGFVTVSNHPNPGFGIFSKRVWDLDSRKACLCVDCMCCFHSEEAEVG